VTTLVLLRHGQSESNRGHRFTGWSDVALTPQGMADSEEAGRKLAAAGHRFDVCFTSVLERGSESARAALRGLGQPDLPLHQSWRLNERHFGALQDMSRRDARRRYGSRQIRQWQRSYAKQPPPLPEDDPRARAHRARYADLCPEPIPSTESFADTRRRITPYWRDTILPHLKRGESVLVVGHKNSLRVLAGEIENLEDASVPRLYLPTAHPLVFEFDEDLNRVGESPLLEKSRGSVSGAAPRRRNPVPAPNLGVLQVIIGTQPNQYLAERVLEYSIRKSASKPVQIRRVHQDQESVGGTRFGFVRFMVPSLCEFQGRAIYLDADQVVLGDIHELAEELQQPFAVGLVHKLEGTFAGKPVEARNETSVMVLDCDQLSAWNPEKIFDPVVPNGADLEAGQIHYRDFMRLAWLDRASIQEIDSRWNHYNMVRSDTKLVHFSHVREQPWKRPGHPFMRFWDRWLAETIAAGELSRSDVLRAVLRRHLHPYFLKHLI
jgi:bisphosphoglycerate-dependent phosphoglycerate mutase family 1